MALCSYDMVVNGTKPAGLFWWPEVEAQGREGEDGVWEFLMMLR